ncbi:MAG: hypothetical protein AAF387_15620 [Pseudomonadota bacterium]
MKVPCVNIREDQQWWLKSPHAPVFKPQDDTMGLWVKRLPDQHPKTK